MESVKDSIQQRLGKIKYNYLLFFHPEKIKLSDTIIVNGKKSSGLQLIRQYNRELTATQRKISQLQEMENVAADNIGTSNQELIEYQNKSVELQNSLNQLRQNLKRQQEVQKSKIYQDKANLHIKLGAKKFQKFVKKFDKAKFKFIKRYIKEDRLLKWSDAIDECKAKRKLKKSKSDQEKKKIIETMKRSKVLVRKQLKEERTISYFSGVDKRIELFPAYLERNKNIHKKSLKRNGIILGISIGLGALGLPLVACLLGGY